MYRFNVKDIIMKDKDFYHRMIKMPADKRTIVHSIKKSSFVDSFENTLN